MKHIKEFDEFINEAVADKYTINASIWNGETPEMEKTQGKIEFKLYSYDLLSPLMPNISNLLGKPNVVVLSLDYVEQLDKCFLSIGYGTAIEKYSKSDEWDKRYHRADLGDKLPITIKELRKDPKGVAKKAAALWVTAKKSFDMNFQPHEHKAVFKIEKDLDKPTLELIEFALKTLK